MPDLIPDIKLVRAIELFGLTDEVINQGGHAWITVTGMSMYPFLAEVRDSVELSKADFNLIKKGDIVLIKRETGEYVLHRVLKTQSDCFFMIGDAQQWVEGPLFPEQLQAVVTRIKRKGKVIRCDNYLLRFYVFVWRLAIPLRYSIIKLIHRKQRLLSIIKNFRSWLFK